MHFRMKNIFKKQKQLQPHSQTSLNQTLIPKRIISFY